MVDFNNETTIGTPAVDIERVTILQRRHDLIEAIEDYKKKRFNNVSFSIGTVRARLFSFFLEIQGMLKRKLSPEEYIIRYNTIINSTKEQEIMEIFYFLNEYLDAMKLTRIDLNQVYDRSRWGNVNKAKGLD